MTRSRPIFYFDTSVVGPLSAIKSHAQEQLIMWANARVGMSLMVAGLEVGTVVSYSVGMDRVGLVVEWNDKIEVGTYQGGE